MAKANGELALASLGNRHAWFIVRRPGVRAFGRLINVLHTSSTRVTMERYVRAALTALAACVCVQTAFAQTGQRFSIQGSGLYAGLFGEAFDEIEDGVGGEVQVRYTPGVISWGFGLQYTSHNTAGEAKDVITKAKLAGVFVEPRYVVDIGSSRLAPYFSGRFAYSQMSLDIVEIPNVTVDIDEPRGPTINGGGGVLIRLSSRANLDIGVTIGYTSFNDIEGHVVGNQAFDFTVEVGSGTNLVGRIGFAIGLGG
jgi:hypothetical protein